MFQIVEVKFLQSSNRIAWPVIVLINGDVCVISNMISYIPTIDMWPIFIKGNIGIWYYYVSNSWK